MASLTNVVGLSGERSHVTTHVGDVTLTPAANGQLAMMMLPILRQLLMRSLFKGEKSIVS